MRYSLIILLFSATCAIAGKSYSQSARIDLDMKDIAVKEVLNEIEKNSEFHFLYSSKLIDVDRKVTIYAENQPIKDILNDLFVSTKVDFLLIDRQIVLSPGDYMAEAKEKLQTRTITGTVTDEKGAPMPGVSVLVKGIARGTNTNTEGKYTIEIEDPAEVLIFSFIGYLSKEITAGDQRVINVNLELDILGLEEVIVVGYGQQKKINLTGSVANVNIDQLEKKAITFASQALAGEISGVSIRQVSGQPGYNQGQIRIRGLASFSSAGNDPLVLIDGISGSLDGVNPNDIESISVLKDAASASIYGARAANGVILIQTRRGQKGDMKVSYSGYIGKTQAVEFPDFVDSWTYAEAVNERNLNTGGAIIYTPEDIEKFKSGEDPDNYPNCFHYKDLFTSGNGLQNNHNLTLKGGTSDLTYLFSAGYINQNGIIRRSYYDRYDIRLNVNSSLRDNLRFNVNIFGNQSATDEPAGRGQAASVHNLDGFGLITMATRLPNITPGKRSDGTYGGLEGQFPEAYLDSESFYKNDANLIVGNASLEWDILKSLSVTGKIGYNSNNDRAKHFGAYIADYIYSGSNSLTLKRSTSSHLSLESFIKFNKEFGGHSVLVLGGISQESYTFENLTAYREKFTNNLLYELDAGGQTNMKNTGTSGIWKLRSFFGRMNYSFKGKYLVEANMRYDGTSRFPEGNRYSAFPSFSAGWRISEENFFQNTLPWINNLKIRGSWGLLGNQEVGIYPYQEVIKIGTNYVIGGKLVTGAAVTALSNKDIKWESTSVTDMGFDIAVLDGKISLTVDYFYKKTFDILYSISVSNVLGMTPSEVNAGIVENKGWDFELDYKNRIGGIKYSVHPTFSVVSNKVLELAGVERDINKGLFIGEPLQAIYGYVADGLFVDEQDVANYATQMYTAEPGTVRYKDISGPDGIPDGKVTADYDRKVIGSEIPKYIYGMGITADYKGFDLYIQLQGEGGNQRRLYEYQYAMWNGGNLQKWQWEGRWTKENPDRNAAYPKLPHSYMPISSFFTRDASYLRIKNIQIGYNLPSKLINRTFIERLRIYLSGQNLITFDNYFPGWDPEMSIRNTQSQHHPPTSLILLGFNIDF